MPNCFQLTRKGSHVPSTFQDIDRAICQNLDLPFDDVRWVEGWYDIIGFSLACGKTFDWCVDYFHQRITETTEDWHEHYRNLIRIVHFLNENYVSDAWYETKR